MAERTLSDKTVTVDDGKHGLLKQLMDAIHSNNKIKCGELLLEISVRQVNCLVRLKYPGYIGYIVTPLLWAVINRCYGIVELLLANHAKVDRIGTYRTCYRLYSMSPLLKAIENTDSKMVNILLEKGADLYLGVPGVRQGEEEGGTLQYNKYLFPLNVCLGKDIELFKTLLIHADLGLEYGPGKHTSLCYALEYFLENVYSSSSLSFVKEVLNFGGRFCKGALDYVSFQQKGICCHLRALEEKIILYQSADEEMELTVYSRFFHCLQVVSSCDYSHGQSPIYCLCRQYAKVFRPILELTPPYNDDERVQDCMLWIIKYTEEPSSLKHISRVAVRRCLYKPINHSQCEKLSLPTKLLKYIMLDD